MIYLEFSANRSYFIIVELISTTIDDSGISHLSVWGNVWLQFWTDWSWEILSVLVLLKRRSCDVTEGFVRCKIFLDLSFVHSKYRWINNLDGIIRLLSLFSKELMIGRILDLWKCISCAIWILVFLLNKSFQILISLLISFWNSWNSNLTECFIIWLILLCKPIHEGSFKQSMIFLFTFLFVFQI